MVLPKGGANGEFESWLSVEFGEDKTFDNRGLQPKKWRF